MLPFVSCPSTSEVTEGLDWSISSCDTQTPLPRIMTINTSQLGLDHETPANPEGKEGICFTESHILKTNTCGHQTIDHSVQFWTSFRETSFSQIEIQFIFAQE